ncbi:DENN domain-containing protein 4C [Phlyctochytrium planicorne]|nr:DENN domain-containing protein 4C [Phlyctochytrium planicorne]
MATSTSLRFVDYFFQAGLPPQSSLLDRRTETDELQGDAKPGVSVRGSIVGNQTSRGIAIQTSLETVKFDVAELTPNGKEPETPADCGEFPESSSHLSLNAISDNMYYADILLKIMRTGSFRNISQWLKYGPPPATYHSFVITEESGAKIYGVCIVIYEKLHSNLQSQLEAAIEEWKTNCLNGLPADPRNPEAYPADILAEAEEKVALYNELLHPMKSMLVDAEHEEEWRPQDATIVDLDNNTIDMPVIVPSIPLKDRKKLITRLQKYAGMQSQHTPMNSPSSSLSQLKEKMKGIPITVKYAYPNGVLVPFSNISKRWINADLEALSRSSQHPTPVTESLNRTGRALSDRRASNDSIFSDRYIGAVEPSRTGSTSFFSKFNKSITHPLQANNSNESFSSSLDTLLVGNGPTDKAVPVAKPSVLIQSGDGKIVNVEESDVFDDADLDRPKRSELVRRRTRSTTPEYGDPNTLPPLAPLVLNGDLPGHGYTGVPIIPIITSGGESVAESLSPDSSISPSSPQRVKNSTLPQSREESSLSFVSLFSFSPSTSQASRSAVLPRKTRHNVDAQPIQSDAWSIPTRNIGTSSKISMYAGSVVSSTATSPTYFPSNGNLNHGDMSSLFSTQQKNIQENTTRLSDSKTDSSQQSPKLIEGHAFVQVTLESLTREADIGEDPTTTPSVAHNSEALAPPMIDILPHKDTSKLTPTAPFAKPFTGPRAKPGVRDVSFSTPDLSNANLYSTNVKRQVSGSSTLLKGDYMPKLPDHLFPEPVKKAIAEEAMRKGSQDHGLDNGVANIVGMDLVQDDWFKKDDFLNSQDKDTRPFLTSLVETQSFAQFTLDRIERPESDYEILFFDESIKAKLNRSKLKFSKETTPFLKDSTYNIRATVAISPPNLENLDPTFDTSLFIPGRPVAPLVTQSDQKMMRSHTIELVQRARMASGMKRKQDFSKWMRTKLKHFQKIGGGEIVSIGHLSDEQRRELFEERLHEVAEVIDGYEAAHLSSLSPEEIKAAIDDLHSQHLILMKAADEEQLVDSSDQDELQNIYNRLFRVITIYEDHHITIDTPTTTTSPHPPNGGLYDDEESDEEGTPNMGRRDLHLREMYAHPLGNILGEVNKEILQKGVEKNIKSVWRKVDREISMVSLPSSVRSRSSSLKSFAGKKGLTLSTSASSRDLQNFQLKQGNGSPKIEGNFGPENAPNGMPRTYKGPNSGAIENSVERPSVLSPSKRSVMISSNLRVGSGVAESIEVFNEDSPDKVSQPSETSLTSPNFEIGEPSPESWITPEILNLPSTSFTPTSPELSDTYFGLNSLVAATRGSLPKTEVTTSLGLLDDDPKSLKIQQLGLQTALDAITETLEHRNPQSKISQDFNVEGDVVLSKHT